ncbi:glycosyl hydrolase family 43 [Leptospira yasudae]|uniref:glycosyl hydrolase family 43 n=1 Tax=Leptospira yasudae TaxID=2202201 RepID=UPI001C4F93BA|nr:glycosyl hydrolase family 43 [Leptospira yasudae]MBW0435779.1 glycosyl hydrolase family 43 [Leptospira yasudae]
MKTEDFKNIRWSLYPGNPVLEAPYFTPLIADPSFLESSQSPDGKFHLFCHTLFGIHRYESENGFEWKHAGLLFRHAMRPFVYHKNGIYYLLYERYTPYQILFSWVSAWKWNSRIEMRTSADLKRWSSPKILFEPTLNWHRDRRYGNSVGNPCLLETNEKYRLYYSASLEFVPDCGFCEPKYIGVAEADNPLGPYKPKLNPSLSPDTKERNLASGALKVLKTEDGYIGFENCIYLDSNGRSGSAIRLLSSFDGISWQFLTQEPILSPTHVSGWMRSHIYALDVKFLPAEKKWFLYFNARDDWHWTRGKERIGLLIGE